jgi:hypothetical protein
MASREFLYIVHESAYLTPKSSPVVGTDAIYVRLDGSNAFKGRPKPVTVKVPYGGGVAIDAFVVSDKLAHKWTLSVLLYASQAQFLLSWAGVRIGGGGTTPWTTTEPVGDLGSCAIYHGITVNSGSTKRRVYLGSKVDQWTIEVSEDGTTVRLTLSGTSSTPQGNQFDSSSDPTSTPFPVPTDAQLAVDPYLFIHTNGDISIASTRAQVTSLKITSKNKMGGKFFNSRFLQLYHFYGRETSLEASLVYALSPDDRTSFEGLTSLAVTIEFNNGTHTFTLTFNAQNVFDDVDDDLPIDNIYLQNDTLANLYDSSAGSDFTLVFT